jgi:hypothetical protein
LDKARDRQGVRSSARRAVRWQTNVKLCISVGINLGGCFGWELGDRFDTMTAFLLSGAGSMAGVFAARWAERRLLA